MEGAKAALADLHKVKPEINSIANSYVYAPFLAYPSYRALIDKTINEGLSRVRDLIAANGFVAASRGVWPHDERGSYLSVDGRRIIRSHPSRASAATEKSAFVGIGE